jgi:hypothetical protein
MGQELTARLRVVFLSSGGLLGDVVLGRLVSCGRFEVAGVVRSRRVMIPGAGFLRGAAAYFARCGIPYTVYIWTITTFAEFLGFSTGNGSITARCRKLGIPMLHTRDVNSPEGLDFIQKTNPQLLVTAHFDQRLRPPLCDGPGLAVLNIHPSPLPCCRGLEPVLHAMLAGGNFGTTVHRLVESIDAGAVLATRNHFPQRNQSVLHVTHQLISDGVGLLENLSDGQVLNGPGKPQQGPSTYHSWPKAGEVRKLYFSGKQLLKPGDLSFFFRSP